MNPYAEQERTARRRDRYATDPAFRAAEQERLRERYRARCNWLRENGARSALNDVKKSNCATYTFSTLSVMMGRSRTYLSRLVAKGLWPAPAGGGSVFTKDEVVRLLAVFAVHEDTVSSYRGDHLETKRRLFEAAGGRA